MADETTARVRYTGPFADGVYVPALDRVVGQGEAVEAPLAVAASLALQGDWQAVGKSADPIAAAQADIPQGAPATEGGA